jgi:site-specific recombinase XerD
MEYVEPIKDIEKITLIKKYLLKTSVRDFLLFTFGINTGLRISQMLCLSVQDVFTDNIEPKTFLLLNDNTTPIFLNRNIQEALCFYMEQNNPPLESFLFYSKNPNKPLTRQQAYRVVKRATSEVGMNEHIGTHTLRKTFGYHAYRQGVALSLLQQRFNHATKAETLKYIGIEKRENSVPLINVNL